MQIRIELLPVPPCLRLLPDPEIGEIGIFEAVVFFLVLVGSFVKVYCSSRDLASDMNTNCSSDLGCLGSSKDLIGVGFTLDCYDGGLMF